MGEQSDDSLRVKKEYELEDIFTQNGEQVNAMLAKAFDKEGRETRE